MEKKFIAEVHATKDFHTVMENISKQDTDSHCFASMGGHPFTCVCGLHYRSAGVGKPFIPSLQNCTEYMALAN